MAKTTPRPKAMFSSRISADLHDELMERAKIERRPITTLVEMALEHYFQSFPRQPAPVIVEDALRLQGPARTPGGRRRRARRNAERSDVGVFSLVAHSSAASWHPPDGPDQRVLRVA